MRQKITPSEFHQARHPKEESRANLAILVGMLAFILLAYAVYESYGAILTYIVFAVFGIWFGLSVAKANLIGNSVRVSKHNFPEIYQVYEEVKDVLSYQQDVPIYIIEDGSVNAIIAKFFGTKFIVLNSALVEDMADEKVNINQIRWIIGRFIGALRAKHFQVDFIRVMIDLVESAKVFNLFILPYQRALQYTGDNIGLLVCENVEDAFVAYNKFMVGNALSDRVSFEGIVDQGRDLNDSFFAIIARLVSAHPHQVHRYLNLLAYARKTFPEQFETLISKYTAETALDIGSVLPKYR